MKRILVVDDSKLIRRMMVSKLGKLGLDVIDASDGAIAIPLAMAIAPDLIFLDIMMPEMDGLETCRKLRELDNLADTPIIMLTAKGSQKVVTEAFESGATDYIVKPFKIKALVEKIEKHLNIKFKNNL